MDHPPLDGGVSPLWFTSARLFAPDITGKGSSIGDTYEPDESHPEDAAPPGAIPAITLYPSA
ncbi:hypothetical protein [Streptomyces nanshensis]|uniref:Uncharacterized protein n=1 Tax=Streptomyces nanshensis TaxID=518642 RepID=A0A1E7L5S8_9ACTN|nr:hypothetical protein [Streptomyces nanshensis]OEV11518.1 hypothetical protein AN218_12500 [Streptomyces nanshensis]